MDKHAMTKNRREKDLSEKMHSKSFFFIFPFYKYSFIQFQNNILFQFRKVIIVDHREAESMSCHHFLLPQWKKPNSDLI